jgi:hypothetical protein
MSVRLEFYNLYFCKSRFLIPQNKEKAPKIIRARSRHLPLVNRSNRVCSVDMAGNPHGARIHRAFDDSRWMPCHAGGGCHRIFTDF